MGKINRKYIHILYYLFISVYWFCNLITKLYKGSMSSPRNVVRFTIESKTSISLAVKWLGDRDLLLILGCSPDTCPAEKLITLLINFLRINKNVPTSSTYKYITVSITSTTIYWRCRWSSSPKLSCSNVCRWGEY